MKIFKNKINELRLKSQNEEFELGYFYGFAFVLSPILGLFSLYINVPKNKFVKFILYLIFIFRLLLDLTLYPASNQGSPIQGFVIFTIATSITAAIYKHYRNPETLASKKSLEELTNPPAYAGKHIPACDFVGKREPYIFAYRGSEDVEEILVSEVYVSQSGSIHFRGCDSTSDDFDFLFDTKNDLTDLFLERETRWFKADDVL